MMFQMMKISRIGYNHLPGTRHVPVFCTAFKYFFRRPRNMWVFPNPNQDSSTRQVGFCTCSKLATSPSKIAICVETRAAQMFRWLLTWWIMSSISVYQFRDTDPVVRMIQYFDIWYRFLVYQIYIYICWYTWYDILISEWLIDIWYRFFWILIYSDRRTISISHFANCTRVCCLSFAYNPTQVVQTCMNCYWNHSELKLVPKLEIQGIHIHKWY